MRRMAKGEGKAGCVFYSLLVIVIAILAVKVVPVQVSKMQLKDHMKELAMTSPRKNADWFERRIKSRADDLFIPVEKKNIEVKKTSKRVVMDVKYTVVLDLVFMEYPLQQKIHLDREIFLF